jgi:HEAT repeat protein
MRTEQEAHQREEAERRQRAELEARIRAEVEAKLRAEEAERRRADLRDETEFASTSAEWFRGGESSEFQPVSIPEAEETMVPSPAAFSLDSRNHEDRAAAVRQLASHGSEEAFDQINEAFDDPAPEVRNAAARALFDLQEDRAAAFTRALRDAPIDRRARIGAAIAESGLADQAINNLTGESRDRTYDAFSLLFLMSKSGELSPLLHAIEEHPSTEARLAVVKLLALSGQPEVLPAFRRMAVRGSLPPEVRSAVMEAIYQISGQATGEDQPTD